MNDNISGLGSLATVLGSTKTNYYKPPAASLFFHFISTLTYPYHPSLDISGYFNLTFNINVRPVAH